MQCFCTWLKPKKESGLRGQSDRVFLHSEKGYATIELFRYIMERFIKCWTATRSGLDCFLVCDSMSVDRDYDIVENTRNSGIHFINIIPGPSHWFQVHDQELFGIRKKKNSDEKKNFFSSYRSQVKSQANHNHRQVLWGGDEDIQATYRRRYL